MKELLVGMGIGFVVGAVMCKTNKPVAETIEKTVEKGKEIFTDIKEEIESHSKKSKNQSQIEEN
ncbi:MAG: hypothetical protein IKA36_03980 [Clostridia bacterium]|nr:hypothetical protein [Clostridia bacterium]